MAKQIVATEAKKTVPARIKEFYQDVMAEMTKVTWPSREELKTSTSVVLILLAVVAAIVYAYDFIFQILVFGLFKLV